MRRLVSVRYENDRALCVDPQTDEVVRVFEPETLIGVGNSIGGYYCRGTNHGSETRVELVRVSGPEKYLKIEQVWDLAKERKGEEIRPGLMMMAVSSGAARNGVFHRYNAPRTPLEFALRDRCCSFRIVERVESIDVEVSRGGNLCSHSTREGSYRSDYETDCQTECVRDGEHVQSHANQFHIGCMCSPATYRIHGGTFVVQTFTHKCMNGCNATEVTKVIITPRANLEAVAEAVRKA